MRVWMTDDKTEIKLTVAEKRTLAKASNILNNLAKLQPDKDGPLMASADICREVAKEDKQ